MTALGKLLDKQNISYRDLGKQLDIRNSSLVKYVNNSNTYYSKGYLRVYWRIAQLLKCDVEYVILGDIWKHNIDIIDHPISLFDAVSLKAKQLNTSVLDVHNMLRQVLDITNYSILSGYENYRFTPSIKNALLISNFLGCTINALWGNYFREKFDAK